MEAQTIKWLKISFAIYFLVILTLGFLGGYMYQSIKHKSNSLTSSLKEINDFNKADFSCSCISATPSLMTFAFDEKNISKLHN